MPSSSKTTAVKSGLTDPTVNPSRRQFLEKTGTAALVAVVAGNTNPLKAEELVLEPGTYQPLDPAKKVRLGVVGGGFGSRMFWNFEPKLYCACGERLADRPARPPHEGLRM